MSTIKKLLGKTWVYVAAAALIAGSGTVMAASLNGNIPENASAIIAGNISPVRENLQNQAPAAGIAAEYTVVDLSEGGPELRDVIIGKLNLQKDLTPDEIEEKYNDIIAAMTPGEKDITAQQAAAFAADILKKAYGVGFEGYTARANFSRSPVPGSDSWSVIFHAPNEDNSSIRYMASVDSVSGKMLNAGFFSLDYSDDDNKNLDDPSWTEKAIEAVSAFKPENASVTGSSVVFKDPGTGITIVCDLSDGSAYAVRLSGENKDAVMYTFFPDGYDGSLDVKPVTGNGAG